MKFIKNYSNWLFLIGIIAFAFLVYNFTNINKEFLGIIIAPFTTILAFLILEENKTKWASKYDTFKTLYANRGDFMDEKSINCLNSIDILFINDKEVRNCWKKLYETYNKASENLILQNSVSEDKKDEIQSLIRKNNSDMDIAKIELLKSMASSLGLSKDINYDNIASSYKPGWVGEGRQKTELNYYQAGTLFFSSQLPPPKNSNGDP